GWQGKMLYVGGKAIIIKHILQSQAIHLFAAMVPPKTILNQMEKYFSNFFWGQREEKNNYHWSSWEKMCYPTDEGGLGFKRLQDICKAFNAKRWWRIRTEENIWSKFLTAKYCPRSNLVSKIWNPKDSSIWKSLMDIRPKVEPHILWKINNEDALFWWDNWSNIGPLANNTSLPNKPGNIKITHFVQDREWNSRILKEYLPEPQVQAILEVRIGPRDHKDQPIWSPTIDGRFSCASAWNILRQRKDRVPHMAMIWRKEIPFKISFFMWRLLNKKLPLDDNMGRFNFQNVSRCTCCRFPREETCHHVFASGDKAKRIWNAMSMPLGIRISEATFGGILRIWWQATPNNAVHNFILKITPIFVLWELWKVRCAKRYGSKNTSDRNIFYQILFNIKIAISKRFCPMNREWSWVTVCNFSYFFRPKLTSCLVKWSRPPVSSIIVNTDGSYITSINKAGAGGIVRKEKGDMVMAFAKQFQFLTNNYSEAQAALFGITWCCDNQWSNFI
ncbi:putative ribonuclease h protein, partial [Nicotiana attenuata]